MPRRLACLSADYSAAPLSFFLQHLPALGRQDEKYLGDRDVLVAAAAAAGLPADDARKMLEDDQAYLAEVQAELSMAQQLRVSGVPFFVFHPPNGVQGRPLGVSGAQPTETIVEILSDDLGLDAEHTPAASG